MAKAKEKRNTWYGETEEDEVYADECMLTQRERQRMRYGADDSGYEETDPYGDRYF